ncbi:MAG: hypothetical protein WC861_05740 [Candidatus Micrarchaeia archaeon]|jgi:hypothetical protein
MVMKKGQAALDFLMTYGWAIALVVIVAAALFALGVFDVSNFVGTKAAGFSGVAVQGWSMTGATGILSVKLTNQVGQRINITGVSATIGATTNALNTTDGVILATGETSSALANTVAFTGINAGAGYQAALHINYTDLNSGFAASTTGTLTGKAV